ISATTAAESAKTSTSSARINGFAHHASVERIQPRREPASPVLVDADDEVDFGDLLARHLDLARRVQLPQQERVLLPAGKLLDQRRLVLFVDDDVAAPDRRLERVDVQQPPLLI